MTRKRLCLFDSSTLRGSGCTKLTMYSVIVSAMVSESRTFTVNEFPEWSRLFWILWLHIPCIFARTGKFSRWLAIGTIATLKILQADWTAGIGFILGLVLPAGIATG